MKELNWGDELLGKVIAPEDWIGGLIENQGEWEVQRPFKDILACVYANEGEYLDKIRRNYRPIYPPAGFNGKTEAEIWEAMADAGADGYYAEIPPFIEHLELGDFRLGNARFYIEADGKHTIRGSWDQITPEHAPILILALQNAMLLSKRLLEANNECKARSTDGAAGIVNPR